MSDIRECVSTARMRICYRRYSAGFMRAVSATRRAVGRGRESGSLAASWADVGRFLTLTQSWGLEIAKEADAHCAEPPMRSAVLATLREM